MRVFVELAEEFRQLLFDDDSWRRLEGMAEIDVMPENATSLPDDVCDSYDVLITGWGTPQLAQVDGERLKLIVHTAGSWRDALGPDVFTSRVVVSQAGSDPMARAVAEFALTMELMLLREAHTYDRGMQSTRDWVQTRHPEFGTGIHTVRHGLVGLSRVGVWHARMLRGLGCEDIVAFDPYFSPERAAELGVRLVPLDDAMSSVVVAAHAPVTPETRKMIGAEELARIPDGGIFLNTARSAIVDGDALERELLSGRIRAGLDVFDEEPLSGDSKLFGLPNVLLTPHVAGATRQARWEQGACAVDEVERFLAGERLLFEVDKAAVAHLS